MKVFETVASFREWRGEITRVDARVGVVMTMGALHEGHERLFDTARKSCDVLVGSVFVNPSQFGPKEDLSKYPRTWDEDVARLRRVGVDALLSPQVEEMYPAGFSTWVEEEELSRGWCGAFRPGHFRGVATVVLKLFHIVDAHDAWFGLKDLQQFWVIQKMVKDLCVPVRVHGVPTVRDADGLAMSSRNRFLSPLEREVAPQLHRALVSAAQEIALGDGSVAAVSAACSRAKMLLVSPWNVQYLEYGEHEGCRAVLAAAMLGSTRLIDNVKIESSEERT